MNISRIYQYIKRKYPEQRYLECGGMPNTFYNPGPDNPPQALSDERTELG
jgi:hypothetical protein